MQPLQTWAIGVCAAAMVCAVLYRLFPDTSLGKQGRLLLPILFLSALLSPLLSGRQLSFTVDAMDDTSDAATLQAQVRRQTVQQVNATLLQMVNQALASHGYHAEKVVTDMDIVEDGSIHMGQIVIYVDDHAAERSALIKQVAEQRLGMPVSVQRMEVHGD